MRTYVRMIACVHLPRFELIVACGEGPQVARQTLAGGALALAPLPGSEQRVGEVSAGAEASGVTRGMLLGEALARCPELTLVPPDPVRVAEAWEAVLGGLAAIGRAALADRFGEAGVLAHRLACGEDEPLRPRHAHERIRETLDVGEAGSGAALERVLGVLVDRLLARRERRGRTLRAVTLSARLVSGGGWREHVVFRQALCDRERISLALSARLVLLPAPAAALGLEVERFGPQAGAQRALLAEGRSLRAARLREAVAQVRAVAGADAALRAVCVDPDSRVPERRVLLTPRQG